MRTVLFFFGMVVIVHRCHRDKSIKGESGLVCGCDPFGLFVDGQHRLGQYEMARHERIRQNNINLSVFEPTPSKKRTHTPAMLQAWRSYRSSGPGRAQCFLKTRRACSKRLRTAGSDIGGGEERNPCCRLDPRISRNGTLYLSSSLLRSLPKHLQPWTKEG